MRPAATRPRASSTLYVAFELGNTEWKLAMTPSLDQAPRVTTMPARDLQVLAAELTRAKTHFGLTATAAVVTCYEAGRDGFWLHRYLAHCGIVNRIVDSAIGGKHIRPLSDRNAIGSVEDHSEVMCNA